MLPRSNYDAAVRPEVEADNQVARRRGPWAPVFMDRWLNAKLFKLQRELRLNELEAAMGRWCQLDRFVRLYHPEGGFPLTDVSVRQFSQMAGWGAKKVRAFFAACIRAEILEARDSWPDHWAKQTGERLEEYVWVHGYERTQGALLESSQSKRERERIRGRKRRDAARAIRLLEKLGASADAEAPSRGTSPGTYPPTSGGTYPPTSPPVFSENINEIEEVEKTVQRTSAPLQLQVQIQREYTNQLETTDACSADAPPAGLVGESRKQASEFWETAVEKLEGEGRVYAISQAQAAPSHIDGETLVLACPDKWSRDWCAENVAELVQECLPVVPGAPRNVECRVDEVTWAAWQHEAAQGQREALKNGWTPKQLAETLAQVREDSPARQCHDNPTVKRLQFALAWCQERCLPVEALVGGYRAFLRDAYWGMEGRGWATNLFCTAGVLEAKLGRLAVAQGRAMGE